MLEMLAKNQIEHKIIFTSPINKLQEISKILDRQKGASSVDFFQSKTKAKFLKLLVKLMGCSPISSKT